MQVTHVNGILGDVIAELVGRAVSEPLFRSAPRHPHGEPVRMVITPPCLAGHLGDGRAPEFATPNQKGFFQ